MIPAELWPRLSERFGLHPRDARLTPEQGGLTYDELEAYLDALGDPPGFYQPVALVDPR